MKYTPIPLVRNIPSFGNKKISDKRDSSKQAKSQAGYTAEVRAIVTKYGASRLSDIDPKDFAAVLKRCGRRLKMSKQKVNCAKGTRERLT